jgi:uncharacterized membrane protein YbhN (UPF0104 family)
MAGAAALFVAVLSAADLQRVTELVDAIGFVGVVVVLVPQAAAILAESFGWKLALRRIGRDVGLRALVHVRVATEALSQTLPAGVVFGESAKPVLLARHAGLSVGEGVAALVARKYLLLLSQAAYVLVVAVVGYRVLERVSPVLLGTSGLQWVALGVGCLLGAGALAAAAWLRRAAVACHVLHALQRIPLPSLSRWLAGAARRFSDVDATVAAFFRCGFLRQAVPALWFVLGWAIESAETFAILRVLGADVSFVEIASLEILLTFLRHALFVVPAGLGVQDLGYVAAFSALGLPEAASLGAAFVLVKRTKELAWIALGYALLAGGAKPRESEPLALGRAEPSRA